mmetsp:Transcript_3398/g.5934  ORF Transcript_3398/g.5934 Transcript_3398/m.5934 type:complete len:131 (-) Transcript_3398:72-464(-)
MYTPVVAGLDSPVPPEKFCPSVLCVRRRLSIILPPVPKAAGTRRHPAPAPPRGFVLGGAPRACVVHDAVKRTGSNFLKEDHGLEHFLVPSPAAGCDDDDSMNGGVSAALGAPRAPPLPWLRRSEEKRDAR